MRLPRTAPPRVQLPSQIMTQMLRTKIIECNEHKQLIGGNAGRLLLLAWPRQATAHIIQRGGRSSPMSVGTTLVCVFHRRVHTRHPAVRIADERALVCPPGMCTLVTRRQCRGACRCGGRARCTEAQQQGQGRGTTPRRNSAIAAPLPPAANAAARTMAMMYTCRPHSLGQ